MKKLILFFGVLLVCGFTASPLSGQCDAENLSSSCISKLSDGFNFLKSYKVDGGEKDKVEYSYIFAKGTQYMVNVCSGGKEADGIVISIFDQNRNKVATNKFNNQLLTAIAFPCNATGPYYIQYTFDGSGSRCGGSALGFKR